MDEGFVEIRWQEAEEVKTKRLAGKDVGYGWNKDFVRIYKGGETFLVPTHRVLVVEQKITE